MISGPPPPPPVAICTCKTSGVDTLREYRFGVCCFVNSLLCCRRPNYRYPYYDSSGKGKLLYGYGGADLYQYRSYSPLEGIH